MKRRLMTMILAAGAALGAWADTETVDGIAWNYTVSGGKAQVGIGGYNGTRAVSTSTTGAITIPPTLGGNPVTSVKEYAFDGCSGLTSVTIPDGVTSIGENAFRGCDALFAATTIPGVKLVGGWAVGYTSSLSGYLDLTGVRGIADSAFYSCSGLTSVTIPDGVTSIGSAAFRYCSGMMSVTIPDGVTSLGSYGFSGCSGLTNVTIGAGVTSIRDYVFSGCRGLTSVTIPGGVTSIGHCAFSGCSGLASVTIPDGVTSIGHNAFDDCSGLTSVTIPDGVTSIGFDAFSGCSDALFDTTNIPGVKLVDGWAFGYASSLSGPLDLTGVRGIVDKAFSGCSGLTSVTIPGGVARIGDFTFQNCSGLTSVTIPNSVASIGQNAFQNCSGLTSVTIPNSVTSIGFYAFRYCSGLTSATIGNGVTNIAHQAFYGCTALADVKCHPDAAGLSWRYARDDVKADGSTVIHVKASQLAAYQAKFSNVKATFVGDLAGDATVTPDVSITAGEYFKATLAELGYDVPTDGQTAYSVKAYGLPAGLKLVGNKAVTKKSGKKTVVVKPANVEWWIEGVPTAALDYATNPPYLVITTNGKPETLPLSLGVGAQEVTELEDLALGQSLNEQFYLPGVTNGWTVSGLPTGLKYTAKLVTTTKKKGKKIISVTTNALPYSVYGKTTKAGLFTITAKKKAGAYYETLKFRVLVRPAPVDTAIFGNELTNIVTKAYVPFEWDLTNDVAAVGGKVTKVAGLPAGLAFASATTYKDKKKTQVKQYGQTIVGKPTKPGTYVVTFTKNVTTGTGKKKKTVAKTAQILWVVEPNDAEPELDFNTEGGEIVSGVVGLKYGDLLAFSATSNATVKASGLPAGIKLADLGDGQYAFKGFTAKAGTYLVTVTATLNGKTVTQRVALKVEGLPAWAKGTYNGVVYATSGDLDYAGYGTVSVSSAGKISGKFSENGTNWTFSASSYTGAVPGTRDACPYQGFTCSNVVAKYAYKVTEKDKKGKKKTVTKYLTREFTLDVSETEDLNPVRGMVCMEEIPPEGAAGTAIEAYQNLWGQSGYTALGKKLFYTSKKVPYKTWASVEADGLGEYDTLSMKVTPAGVATATYKFFKGTFDKKGKPMYATYTCTTVLHPETSAEAGTDGFGAMMHLYFPPVASVGFKKYSEVVRYPFSSRKANVPDKAAIDAAKWCAGEYLGYGYAEFPGEDWLYGIFRVSVGADLAFTGTFEAIDGGVADFSGKLVKNVADGVAITVNGTPLSMGVKAMAKPYGKSKYGEVFAWSEAEEGQPNIHIDRAWQNIWTSVGMASARPKIAPGTTKTVDLAGAEIYHYPMGDYVEGDSFTYTFAEDGTVSVTGQVFGVPVDTTTAIAVETENGGTCDCILTFMINGRVFQQNFTMPSSGTVTSESISLDVSSRNFGIING